MSLITANIQWIMLAAGLLTLSMLHAVVAPKAAARAYFGQALEGPAADVVVRNWAFLIVLSALFLIYAAFVEPAYRALRRRSQGRASSVSSSWSCAIASRSPAVRR